MSLHNQTRPTAAHETMADLQTQCKVLAALDCLRARRSATPRPCNQDARSCPGALPSLPGPLLCASWAQERPGEAERRATAPLCWPAPAPPCRSGRTGSCCAVMHPLPCPLRLPLLLPAAADPVPGQIGWPRQAAGGSAGATCQARGSSSNSRPVACLPAGLPAAPLVNLTPPLRPLPPFCAPPPPPTPPPTPTHPPTHPPHPPRTPTPTLQYAAMFVAAGQPGDVKKVQASVAAARKVFRIMRVGVRAHAAPSLPAGSPLCLQLPCLPWRSLTPHPRRPCVFPL